MDNHYHILVETVNENISSAIKMLNSRYASWFNKKYERNGHLFQGRYKSIYITDEKQFYNTLRYIERNPIEAKMVSDVTEYEFQSLYTILNKTIYLELLEGSDIYNFPLEDYIQIVKDAMSKEEKELIYNSPKITKEGRVLLKSLESFFEEIPDEKNAIIEAFRYGYKKSEIAKFLGISHTQIYRVVKNVQKGV